MNLGSARTVSLWCCVALAMSTIACSDKKKDSAQAAASASEEPLKVALAIASASASAAPTTVPSAAREANTPPPGQYHNDRFGFFVTVPSFLVAQPPPANGDGSTFAGKDVELRVWGMNAVLTLAEHCEKPAGATVHQVTKDSCFVTGTAEKRIFWERKRLKDGIVYGMRFEYPESMKAEMDRVVQSTYRSWLTP